MSILRLLTARSPWAGCHCPTPAERVALWHKRRGEHLAQKALQRERIRTLLDQRAARRASSRTCTGRTDGVRA